MVSQTLTRLFVSSCIAFASFLASTHPFAAASPGLIASALADTPSIDVGVVTGSAGALVTFSVTLRTAGESIAGVQMDIAFDPSTPVAATGSNRPSCHPNPAIHKDGTAFTFQPTACIPGSNCTGMRAIVLSLTNVDPIPDGSELFTCDDQIDPTAADGIYPLTASNTFSFDSDGFFIPTNGIDGAVIVFATPPPCGDGVVELDEECDDGNTYGGDGCAANCTLETQRPFPFDRSGVLSIQTAWLQILLPLSGEETIITGSSRPIDETGQIPAVIHTNDLRVDPISVPGLVCLCVTGMDDPELGPGIGGQGTIGCGPSGLTDVDYLNSQDHDIDDVDPGCASGTIESVAHPGVCNGPPRTVRSGGTAPRGSALFSQNIALTSLNDFGTCAETRNPDGTCYFSEYGPDCLPCTSDDIPPSDVHRIHTTTGTATAEIDDADDVAGARIAVGESCAGSPCHVTATGVPFDCDAIAAYPLGGLRQVSGRRVPSTRYDGARR